MSKETPEGIAVDLAALAVDDEALVTDESAADEAVVTEPEPEDGPRTYGTVAARREGVDVVLTADGAEINLTPHDAQLLFRDLRSIITEL